jgi:hypothetical protein
MPAMTALRRGTPTPLWRLLTFLVAVSQLVVVGAAWLDVAEGGRDQRTHVESGGTRQHYVHDDSTCELCVLQHLAGAPSVVRPRDPAVAPAAGTPRFVGERPVLALAAPATRPRAPPATV